MLEVRNHSALPYSRFLSPFDDVSPVFVLSLSFQVISELGLVIYSALDFGLKENEERTLTPGLENLLDLMTSLGECVVSAE